MNLEVRDITASISDILVVKHNDSNNFLKLKRHLNRANNFERNNFEDIGSSPPV